MKKFFKNLFIFLLTITVTISIFAYTMLDSTETFLSKENMINMLKEIDITELLGDEVNNKIYETLEKTGMPTEYADYVLKNDEFKEYIGEYVIEGMEYVLYDKELPTLDEKETTDVLVSSFNQVIEEVNNKGINVEKYLSKEDQNKIVQKIEVYTPEVIEKIPEVEAFINNKLSDNTKYQETINQIHTMMDQIEKIYSYKKIIFILIIVQFILIILLSFKQFKFVKNIGIPFGINALLLYIVNYLIPIIVDKYYPEQLNIIRSLLDSIIGNLKEIWTTIEIKYLIIFISAIIVQIIIHIILKNRKPKELDDIEKW